jgi:adenylate cyclase
MPSEIERKFLVTSDNFKKLAKGVYIHQGYINNQKERLVRIRIYGDDAYLTIKGIQKGIIRAEYEYKIPVPDALEMLDNLCLKPTLQKHRYRIPYDGMTWDVDEFHGENEGLIIAEIELESEDQQFTKPSWVGMEVTDDSRYYNANLAKNPYKNWRT